MLSFANKNEIKYKRIRIPLNFWNENENKRIC